MNWNVYYHSVWGEVVGGNNENQIRYHKTNVEQIYHSVWGEIAGGEGGKCLMATAWRVVQRRVLKCKWIHIFGIL